MGRKNDLVVRLTVVGKLQRRFGGGPGQAGGKDNNEREESGHGSFLHVAEPARLSAREDFPVTAVPADSVVGVPLSAAP
jgi:hypothetical protein